MINKCPKCGLAGKMRLGGHFRCHNQHCPVGLFKAQLVISQKLWIPKEEKKDEQSV